MLTYSPGHDLYKSTGEPKKEWFLRLPPGVDGPDWGWEGEEGLTYGRSVKCKYHQPVYCVAFDTPAGRTMAEVCGGVESCRETSGTLQQ